MENQAKSKKITPKKVFNVIFTTILAIVFVFALVCLGYVCIQALRGQETSLFGLKLYYVETDSMSPTIDVNEMILSKQITDLDDYKKVDSQIDVDDVVTFKQVVNGYIINNTHRVIKDVYYDSEMKCHCIQTKGDNPSAPTDKPIPITDLRAKMVMKFSSLGDIYSFLGSTGGIATMIIIPMALVLISTIYQLVMKIKHPAGKEKEVITLTEEEKERIRKEKEQEIANKAVEEYIALEKRKEEIKKKAIEEYLNSNKDSE